MQVKLFPCVVIFCVLEDGAFELQIRQIFVPLSPSEYSDVKSGSGHCGHCSSVSLVACWFSQLRCPPGVHYGVVTLARMSATDGSVLLLRDAMLAKTVYCVTGLPMSKQQEIVEASFQLRARLLELNAFTFANVDLEAIPVDVAYVTALSQQEVPDYFAGPAMAKTVTQETRVLFGPEQAVEGSDPRRIGIFLPNWRFMRLSP